MKLNKRWIFNLGFLAAALALIILMLITTERKMTTGINLANMDLSIVPGDDFYNFATAGWRAANPIPGEFGRFGAFEQLDERVMEQVRDLIKEISEGTHKEGTIEHKIATIFNSAMDFDKRNADGTLPVLPDIAKVDEIENMAAYLGTSHRIGSAFWNSGVDVDSMDSDSYIFGIGQGGLGLSRDFLVDDDANSRRIRTEYLKYMTSVFRRFGITDAPARAVFDMEIEMAKSFYPKEKLRDPRANYNKMSFAELKNRFPNFDWDAYFEARGIVPDYVDVAQPEPLAKSISLLEVQNPGVIRAYLKWRIANGAMRLLGDYEYDLSFNFYSRILSGTEERRPKWKDATNLVEGTIGEAVGQMYVKKYFPPRAKKRMEDLVENLRRAYADRIKELDWMSDETKDKALAKLAAMNVKIGYPDKWRDYSGMEIKGDSLYADLRRAALFHNDFWIEKLRGRKVDKTMWFMNPQAVNAYYSHSENEICFPAGILQPPFFDMSADDAFNYGAIGVVIGHEITHGFDDSGRHFDKDGNMNDWWTEGDAAAFNARAKVMREFFDNIEVLPGVMLNGEFSLGENLADHGGVSISFDAFTKYGRPAPRCDRWLAARSTKCEGWSGEQRFFIANAGIWASNARPEEIIRRIKSAPHSPPEWRINGILPHIDAWYTAFDVTSDNKMYVAPENRVRLW